MAAILRKYTGPNEATRPLVAPQAHKRPPAITVNFVTHHRSIFVISKRKIVVMKIAIDRARCNE